VANISQKLGDDEGHQLAMRAVLWMRQRNFMLHSIAKSEVGKVPVVDFANFQVEALDCAKSGQILMRNIMTWHRKQIRASEKRMAYKSRKAVGVARTGLQQKHGA
jgi:hypothetical protein